MSEIKFKSNQNSLKTIVIDHCAVCKEVAACAHIHPPHTFPLGGAIGVRCTRDADSTRPFIHFPYEINGSIFNSKEGKVKFGLVNKKAKGDKLNLRNECLL